MAERKMVLHVNMSEFDKPETEQTEQAYPGSAYKSANKKTRISADLSRPLTDKLSCRERATEQLRSTIRPE